MKLVLAMLAASAVASAEPLPAQWIASMPRNIAPELSPPGLTPTIHEMYCVEDPHEKLRTDCFTGDNDHRPVHEHATSRSRPWPDYSGGRNPSDPDRGRANLAPLPSPPTPPDWQAAPMPQR
ncbi:MAG TPA: hypothetical protein VLT45_05495 [Kofleriaceae bacterium]|nr:hypothetical protein [Kofleriaceae bacterium]